MSEGHPFEQHPEANVRVCVCGKWPSHHVHDCGEPSNCGCDECRAAWARAMTPSLGHPVSDEAIAAALATVGDDTA